MMGLPAVKGDMEKPQRFDTHLIRVSVSVINSQGCQKASLNKPTGQRQGEIRFIRLRSQTQVSA